MKKTMIVICVLCLLSTSCRKGDQKNDPLRKEERVDVIIGYDDYPSSVATTYLAKHILENVGYTVALERIERDKLLESVYEHRIDMTLSCFLPDIDGSDFKNYEKGLDDIGVMTQNCSYGLYVPSYSYIADTKELLFYRQNLNKTIYVLKESKALVDEVRKWVQQEQLGFHVKAVDTNELDHVLENLCDKKQWFVFAGWQPHYLMSKYPVHKLEGSNFLKKYPQEMHTVFSSDYAQKDVLKLMKQFKLHTFQVNDLIYTLRNQQVSNYNTLINQWLKKHPSFDKLFQETSMYNNP